MVERKRAIIPTPLKRYIYTRCCGDESIVADWENRSIRRKFGTRWKA
jgi:hypothetical protein